MLNHTVSLSPSLLKTLFTKLCYVAAKFYRRMCRNIYCKHLVQDCTGTAAGWNKITTRLQLLFKLARSRAQTETEDLMAAYFLNSWGFSDCNECCLKIYYEGFNNFGIFKRNKSINNVFCKRREKVIKTASVTCYNVFIATHFGSAAEKGQCKLLNLQK